MGMSTYVQGFRPPDEKWKKMKAIYDLCTESKIAIPEDVLDFFDYEKPDEDGVLIDIEDSVEEFSGDMENGIQVDISKLPKDLKYIKFINSY